MGLHKSATVKQGFHMCQCFLLSIHQDLGNFCAGLNDQQSTELCGHQKVSNK